MKTVEKHAINAMKVTNKIADKSCEDCVYGLEPSTSKNCEPCMKEYKIRKNSPNFVRWGGDK